MSRVDEVESDNIRTLLYWRAYTIGESASYRTFVRLVVREIKKMRKKSILTLCSNTVLLAYKFLE